MSKKTQEFYEKSMQYLASYANGELVEELRKNREDKALSKSLFTRLTELKGKTGRGANLAMALMMDGHDMYLGPVFKAVQAFSRQKCFTVGDFEAMIFARPTWGRRLILVMIESHGEVGAAKKVIERFDQAKMGSQPPLAAAV